MGIGWRFGAALRSGQLSSGDGLYYNDRVHISEHTGLAIELEGTAFVHRVAPISAYWSVYFVSIAVQDKILVNKCRNTSVSGFACLPSDQVPNLQRLNLSVGHCPAVLILFHRLAWHPCPSMLPRRIYSRNWSQIGIPKRRLHDCKLPSDNRTYLNIITGHGMGLSNGNLLSDAQKLP
ncbi:hypothetical protein K432DRAFT_148506 [Lepidopterella palustris CBS 459.81]|uniref:Uncharacterized protein n=1 Tax=Lepidopterella palustris CBS 459.81 TaxID=1314670 RepID=A0A8E2E2V9_9PEZI|nr:hypothetical protein K432DRAFT_148506 [Lepidopterella palustris CBS 459.81]